MWHQHYLGLEPTVYRLFNPKFQKDWSHRCQMRANLKVDVELRLAYDFGQKAYFLYFYVKFYLGQGRVFFFLKRVFFCQRSLFIVWIPFPDAILNPKHFSFYHPPSKQEDISEVRV